ncbi:MAG: putative LPS assembly protein LptD [Gemmatimonadales bacterium]
MRVVVVLLALLAAGSAGAQVKPVRPPAPTLPRNPLDTTLRRDATRPDSSRADSIRADSTRQKELIKWLLPDSITTALMTRPGYDVTRYQGVKVTFNAKQRTLYLEGDPAGVSRGVTILVGDTITYNDSTKVVFAKGDTLILRDPSRGNSDVVALGQMTYNVESRRGTVTNISTAVESGETWYVFGAAAGFVNDTTGGKRTAFYARNGSITSCDDAVPDYHFQSKEIKLISKNILVARPAVLYIADVPVFWLPFIFQDMRSGRRSGIVTPRFGINEIFRNSPSYRRHIENLGYYFAFSDFMDTQVTLDWRSGANTSDNDPGWLKLNGEWRYRWLDRFLTGRLGLSRMWQRDGDRNFAVSWAHQQDFSQTTHLTTDINFVKNTNLQRRTTFDPRQVLATIQSHASYQQQIGPASFSLGGSRRQYSGRKDVSQDFPNFSISTPTLALAKWLEWTPALNITNQEQLKVDRNGEFAYRYRFQNGVVRDSIRATGDSRVSALNFNTPIKIFGFSLQNTVRVSDQENNNPVRIPVINQDDPSQTTDRVFARTFSTEVDWQTSFGLPQFFSGSLKVSPSVGLTNVDPHAYWVRTEQTGGRYVHQSKRLFYGLSSSPTVFGLFPGIGSISRFRHTISPVISYSYAPAAEVSREFLRALNTDPRGYLGSLASNQVTLQISQVLEAKMKSKDTASALEGRKVKLVGLGFSPLSYDFERKRKTGKSGFTTDNFSTEFNSDLLPGFRAGVQYSLFQGNPLSDSAKLKPFRTGIDASFSLNGSSGIFGVLTRIFGRAVPSLTPQVERLGQGSTDALEQRVASTPVAGAQIRNDTYGMPNTQGWQASFTFSSSRQRPPVGNGTVVTIDPRDLCRNFSGIVYDLCIEQQSTNPTGAEQPGRLTAGGPFIRQPSRENITSQMSFHVTPKWAASWGTTYDFRERQFASQSVSLQRELHDWRSIFAFTRSPNGNFSFNFYIALKAQSDIKFNYDKQTYRQTNSQ